MLVCFNLCVCVCVCVCVCMRVNLCVYCSLLLSFALSLSLSLSSDHSSIDTGAICHLCIHDSRRFDPPVCSGEYLVYLFFRLLCLFVRLYAFKLVRVCVCVCVCACVCVPLRVVVLIPVLIRACFDRREGARQRLIWERGSLW
jgi:hypothetical protein